MRGEQSAVRPGHEYILPLFRVAVVLPLIALLGSAVWVTVMWLAAGWLAAVLLAIPILAGFAGTAVVCRSIWKVLGHIDQKLEILNRKRPTSIDYQSKTLGPYPYPYQKVARWRDERGIIEYRRPGQPPLRATLLNVQYALTLWDKVLEQPDGDEREDFLRHANALVEQQQRGGPYDGCWLERHLQSYYYPHTVPYSSSMVQGQSISVLLRAHELTGENRYLDACNAAMQIFEVPVAEGGVRAEEPNGNVVFQEYAIYPFYSHTLNGYIYTLFGLEEFARAHDHARARHWFTLGVETLARPGTLERYDLGYTSTYDSLPGRTLSMAYHAGHVAQLRSLYDMTGRAVFNETADRWERYTKDLPSKVRLAVHYLAARIVSGCWRFHYENYDPRSA